MAVPSAATADKPGLKLSPNRINRGKTGIENRIPNIKDRMTSTGKNSSTIKKGEVLYTKRT